MAISRRSIVAVSTAIGGVAAAAVLTMSPVAAAGAAPTGGCDATARIETQWGSGTSGGQIVAVRVTNTSSVTTTKWAVTWTLGAGQRVVSAWNAVVSSSGGTATAVNASYDGTLAPGGSATFGMQLAGTGPAPALSCDNGVSTPPGGGAGVVVSTTDNQKTVNLHVGDTLEVSLPANYLPPKLSAAGVLAQQEVTGGYPTGQPLVADYTAAAPGTAGVSTTTDAQCNHDPTPCPSPGVPWSITVVVTG
jgi:hypothetical protein